MNIYLDVDGLLLDKNFNLANHANEFIRYVLNKYPDTTYWLSTRCNGNADTVTRQISHLFEPDVVELLKKIKPTSRFSSRKTESIDFSQPFLWFDDHLFFSEKQDLIDHESLPSWIGTNVNTDPDILDKFIKSFPTILQE